MALVWGWLVSSMVVAVASDTRGTCDRVRRTRGDVDGPGGRCGGPTGEARGAWGEVQGAPDTPALGRLMGRNAS